MPSEQLLFPETKLAAHMGDADPLVDDAAVIPQAADHDVGVITDLPWSGVARTPSGCVCGPHVLCTLCRRRSLAINSSNRLVGLHRAPHGDILRSEA